MTILCGLQMESGTVGNPLSGWEDSELAGRSPAVTIQPEVDGSYVIPADYEDITSIPNWEQFGRVAGLDYLGMRKELITLVIKQATAGTLPQDPNSLLVMARNFAMQPAQIDAIFGLDARIVFGKNYDHKATKARAIRMKNVEVLIYNMLQVPDANAVIAEVDDLNIKYTNSGIKGTQYGDIEGIIDYVNAQAGTSYTTRGLAAQDYEPIRGTLAELVAQITDMLAY